MFMNLIISCILLAISLRKLMLSSMPYTTLFTISLILLPKLLCNKFLLWLIIFILKLVDDRLFLSYSLLCMHFIDQQVLDCRPQYLWLILKLINLFILRIFSFRFFWNVLVHRVFPLFQFFWDILFISFFNLLFSWGTFLRWNRF